MALKRTVAEHLAVLDVFLRKAKRAVVACFGTGKSPSRQVSGSWQAEGSTLTQPDAVCYKFTFCLPLSLLFKKEITDFILQLYRTQRHSLCALRRHLTSHLHNPFPNHANSFKRPGGYYIVVPQLIQPITTKLIPPLPVFFWHISLQC